MIENEVTVATEDELEIYIANNLYEELLKKGLEDPRQIAKKIVKWIEDSNYGK